MVYSMSVAGDSNTEQNYGHVCLLRCCGLFFFLQVIANSCEIAETSMDMGVVKENPEVLEREGK